MDDILIIDKPEGMTSHDVCQQVKRALGCRRVGHTGTLDPIATGVLPILLNGATRQAAEFAADEKEYCVTAAFGAATTTYDREGEVTTRYPVPNDLQGRIAAALPQFRGIISQTPPPYSAVKYRGKPLYWWARRGRVVEAPARMVQVHQLELDTGVRLKSDTCVAMRITCSKGTYIRSLVHDLGQAIGCGAHVTALRRLRSGPFRIEEAIQLERITATDKEKILYKKSGPMLA